MTKVKTKQGFLELQKTYKDGKVCVASYYYLLNKYYNQQKVLEL